MYTILQATNIIKKQMDKALHYLPSIDFEIPVKFESIGEGTFKDTKIACVARNHSLIVNLDWFNQTDEQDIKYMIWHEMRHFYQRQQVEAFQKGIPVIESLHCLMDWEAEFASYIPNTPITEERHFAQKIEMDAYAFAFAMLAIYCSKPDGSIDIGLPEVAAEKIVSEASEMYKELSKIPIVREKVDRNGSCPCGSGKKYKKCCMRTGFFE